MSKQALENPYIRNAVLELLIDKFKLWEDLRRRAAS